MWLLDTLLERTSHETTTPQQNGYSTESRVEDVLSSGLKVHNEFYNKNIIVSEEFGVFVSVNVGEWFDFHDFQMQFRICIDSIYSNGIYFSNLDRKTFEVLLYGAQEEVMWLLHPEFNGVRICSAVKQLSEKEIRYLDIVYGWKVQLEKDSMNGIFVPHTIQYLEKMLWEEYEQHDMFVLRGDFFHAYLWWQGIKYFGESDFLENIEGKSRNILDSILLGMDHIVARGKWVTETIDDKRIDYDVVEKERDPLLIRDSLSNEFPSLRVRKKPAIVNGKALTGWEVECIFPKATQGQCVFEIIFWEPGKYGVTIWGTIIPPEAVKRLNVASQLIAWYEEFTLIDDSDDKKLRVIAKEDVYLSVDRQGRIGFTKYKKYIWNIWKNTGSIVLPKDGTVFELQWDIQEWYHIDGFDIIYSGQLFWEIYAENNIKIKSWGILWGKVVSHDAHITVENAVRIQDGTEIEALNGDVVIQGNLNNATVKANTITIFWIATNCVCIGWHIKIHGNNGSKVMAESFEIDQDRSGSSEYTIFVYSGIRWMMNSLQKRIGAKEWEYLRAETALQKMNWDQILVSGNIHPESRFQFLITSFIFSDFLYSFAYPDLPKEYIAAKKSNGTSEVVALDKKNEGVVCSLENSTITRNFATTFLTEKLENQSESRWAHRDPIYSRGLRLQATVNNMKWHIFDYSDTGASFIFRDDLKANDNIAVSSTVDVVIIQPIAFFITRTEKKLINGVSFIFIAWKFITHGIGKKISKIVAIKDTENKK